MWPPPLGRRVSLLKVPQPRKCMIKIFKGGGVVDGEGVAVKDAWNGGGGH